MHSYRSYRTWQCHHNTVALPVLLLAARGDLPWVQKLHQLDLPGATLLLSSTSCLNLALQWGGIIYPWSDAKVFGCLIRFGLLLITFLCLQHLGKENFVPSLVVLVSSYIESTCPACLLTSIQVALYWHHVAS
jgi:hypothetical protein